MIFSAPDTSQKQAQGNPTVTDLKNSPEVFGVWFGLGHSHVASFAQTSLQACQGEIDLSRQINSATPQCQRDDAGPNSSLFDPLWFPSAQAWKNQSCHAHKTSVLAPTDHNPWFHNVESPFFSFCGRHHFPQCNKDSLTMVPAHSKPDSAKRKAAKHSSKALLMAARKNMASRALSAVFKLALSHCGVAKEHRDPTVCPCDAAVHIDGNHCDHND